MNIKQPTRRSLGAGIIICMVALSIPLLSQSEVLPAELPFVDGIAWLSNDDRDELVRVNGQTGQADASLSLEDVENAAVAQAEGIVLVEVDGEIRRIDVASLAWGRSIDADGELVVGSDQAGNPAVYLLMPDGEVRDLDPMTLETRGRIQLDGVPGSGVVANGRLVVTTRTDASIWVEAVDGTELVGTTEVADPSDHVELSRIGDDIAVVNLTAGELTVVPSTGSSVEPSAVSPLDLPPGDILVPTELPDGQLWMLALREGDLLGVDLESGDISTEVQVADPRADLAGPVVLNDTVYVVDRDTGMVIQVDAGTGEVTEQALSDFGMENPSEAEITAVSGKVFVNDPSGPIAVVFSEDGSAEGIDKYAAPAPADESEDDTGPAGDRPDARDRRDEPSSEPERNQPQDAPAAEGPTAPPAPAPTQVTTTTEVPVTLPPQPRPPTPSSTTTTTTATTTTTTTTTAPPTTTTTTQPPTTPPPQPPGSVTLTVAPGDGSVGLSWTAASSETPVTYHVSSDRAIGGQTAWQTTALSHNLTGLTNGVPYQLTVTPANAAGNGPSSSQSVTTAGAPTVSNVSASASSRSITVSFAYNSNGGTLQRCEVSGAGTTATANCSGGTGSATISVPNYYTNYTFTVTVQTSIGTATGSATTRSGTKPLTVDGSAPRWDGSCYYPEHGSVRPVVAQPVETCVPGVRGPEYYVRLASTGSTEQARCWQLGAQIQDDYLNQSAIWLQVGDGWMNTLYFSNWGTADDNLPQC